ncbi:MAG: hypothetical protein U0990_02210 [Candidatus Nanopelagicales bacterium]|nr:hypothetical protein [Candidatus Nanopelagicales bacterium]MDZ4248884.1 hypothetical protein [Candidatus Nanopelagicales bacterium]
MSTTLDWSGGVCRFPSVMFKRLFTPIERPVPPAAQMVTAFTDGQVTLRSNRDKIGYHEAADMDGYKGVRPGDFVVHGLDILRGSVGVSDSAGAISAVCTVCRPSARVDPRFVAHAMRAQASLGVPKAMARGIREGGADFRRWDTLGEMSVPVPPLDDQRRIADYLDAETTRLDALIETKRRLGSLLVSRFQRSRDARLWGTVGDGLAQRGPWPWIPIRHLASIHGGLTLGKSYDEPCVSWPYLRVANVQDGYVNLDDLASVRVPESAARRHALKNDDLLVLEGNGNPANLGRSALWDGSVEPCLHQNHVHAVRADPERMVPQLLYWLLRTEWARWCFAGSEDSVSIATLSQERIASLPVPVPPRSTHAALAAYLATAWAENEALLDANDRSIRLLTERRQALITAAVTGEFQVPESAA